MKVRDWAINWKMLFNPDPTKQAKEVKNISKTTQKHLGLMLDHKLKFQYHVNEKIIKGIKGIGLLLEKYSLFYLQYLYGQSANRI